ncbi:MAG: hypothetical protein H6742_00415 [Alphaproteobacteria bacterium]|nr:hypothetical protein [Alphaproteobacteria bacterium]
MIAWLMLVLACGSPTECDEATPCGFGAVCVEGGCVQATCATSAQCPMESHCDGGACAAGCGDDLDCFPGDACQPDGSCASAECEDGRVDCAFGEFCDTDRGDCVDAGDPYCAQCRSDADCGDGNLCYGWGDNGDWCAVACHSEQDCPAGYSCSVLGDGAGNPIGSYCITWCWLYAEDP